MRNGRAMPSLQTPARPHPCPDTLLLRSNPEYREREDVFRTPVACDRAGKAGFSATHLASIPKRHRVDRDQRRRVVVVGVTINRRPPPRRAAGFAAAAAV